MTSMNVDEGIRMAAGDRNIASRVKLLSDEKEKLDDDEQRLVALVDEWEVVVTELEKERNQLAAEIELLTETMHDEDNRSNLTAQYEAKTADFIDALNESSAVMNDLRSVRNRQVAISDELNRLSPYLHKPIERGEGHASGLTYYRENHRITTKLGKEIGCDQGFRPSSILHKLSVPDGLEAAWADPEAVSSGKNNLVDKLPNLDPSCVRNACLASRYSFKIIASNYGTVGEMTLQQLVYAPFSMLFMAAAGGCNTSEYAADQIVKSSLTVLSQSEYDGSLAEHKVVPQPDAAATLYERWDAFGVMEIKVSDQGRDVSLADQDKCALMTSITAIVLHKCLEKEDHDKIVLPFVIATGKDCSLYVTKLDESGDPCIQLVEYPDRTNAGNVDVGESPSEERSQMLIALAVLLNNFKGCFDSTKREKYKSYVKNRKVVELAQSIKFGSSGSSNRSSSRSSSKRRGFGGDGKNTKIEGKTRNRTAQAAANEAAACSGMFKNVKYPFLRELTFTGEDSSSNKHEKSPFYFKCNPGSSDIGWIGREIFLKVWNLEDSDLGDVIMEGRNHQTAFQAGVPVAAPVLPEIARSKSAEGSEYLVFAVEYIKVDHIDAPCEFLQYCSALIDTIEKLHKQAYMLHCDLKPDNILWSNGVIKLIDFEHAQSISEATCIRGTLGFEAPEILKDMPNTIKTDAFSVGRIILRVLHNLEDNWREDGNEQSPIFSILRHVGKKLTEADPDSRWSLNEASKRLEESFPKSGTAPKKEASVPVAMPKDSHQVGEAI